MKDSAFPIHTAEGLTSRLVAFDSVSHRSNAAISDFVAEYLENLGFRIERLVRTDKAHQEKVSLVARRGPIPGGIGYSGHTDVVPVDDWNTGFNGPFEPIVRHGKLYGRGTCDMKGSLACALLAASNIPANEQKKSLYFVISADEEIGMQGAQQIDAESAVFQEMVDHQVVGIVGEPTELQVVHAHKGSQGYKIRSRGESAHTSTGRGVNANHRLIPALAPLLELYETTQQQAEYQNTDFKPPTLSWNMILINEPQAVNITPSIAEVRIFFRTMPGVQHEGLVERLKEIAADHSLELIERKGSPPWQVGAESEWIQDMLGIAGLEKSITVSYATDAAVLQRLERLMICGPGSIEQAHRNDEWIALDQLERGVRLYESAFRHWAC